MANSSKKTILLVCNFYAPENMIASVRISKLAKYFKRYGYHVIVLTEKKRYDIEDEILKKDVDGIPVLYTENSAFFKKIHEIYQKLIRPHKEKRFNNLENRNKINPKTGKKEFYPFETAYPVIGSIEYLMGQIRQLDLFLGIRKKIKNLKYDYLFTSYGDAFSFHVGKYLKKLNKDKPWICDIRDAIYQYKFVPQYVKWIPKTYERYVWRHADRITGVSKGICKTVPKYYREKVRYISNGFDREDLQYLDINEVSKDKLIFAYTGSMYGGMRDATEFFHALSMLVSSGKINPANFEIHYAGNAPAFEIFKCQAEKYGLGYKCITHGKVTRKESLELQRRSNILLMSAFDYKSNDVGLLTGKLLEYMMMDKPVIAIITGDIEHGDVYEVMQKTKLGVVYEESNRNEDFLKLVKYIESQYNIFMKTGCVEFAPDKREIAKFDYKYLVCKAVNMIEGI